MHGVDLGDVAFKGKGLHHSNGSRNRDRMLKQHLTTVSYILGEFFG